MASVEEIAKRRMQESYPLKPQEQPDRNHWQVDLDSLLEEYQGLQGLAKEGVLLVSELANSNALLVAAVNNPDRVSLLESLYRNMPRIPLEVAREHANCSVEAGCPVQVLLSLEADDEKRGHVKPA